MRKAIIVFSGFTEARAERTGSYKLWHEILDKHRHDVACVFFLEWNDDPKGHARLLNMMGVTEVLTLAYSWGAGFGLREFSKSFAGSVKAVICDPVFHSKFFWMRWRAITSWWKPTIKYPDNVTVLRWFNQIEGEPGADDVNTSTKAETLPYIHYTMDDSPEYQQAALEEAHLFVNGK